MRPLAALALAIALSACQSAEADADASMAPFVDVDGFAVAAPGRAIGGRPTVADLHAAAEAGYGIVVSFLTEDEGASAEAALVAEAGMDYVGMPVRGPGIRSEHADLLDSVLDDAGDTPVFMHCMSGNRAGGVWALYLVRHRGMDVDAALEEARRLGVSKPAILDAVRAAATP